jgi:hypothetical protein
VYQARPVQRFENLSAEKSPLEWDVAAGNSVSLSINLVQGMMTKK